MLLVPFTRATICVSVAFLLACASANGGAAGTDRRTTAPAGVVLDDRVDTYAVHGHTIADVRRSIATEAPTATGRMAMGLDTWNLTWRWRPAAGRGLGCELHDVVVTVSSTILVPAWVADSAAEPGLADRWAAYDAALRRHERGHEALAVSAGAELARALRGVRAMGCVDAAAEGDRIGRASWNALRAVEQQYDDSTGHGRTQGAVWPPPVGAGNAPGAPRNTKPAAVGCGLGGQTRVGFRLRRRAAADLSWRASLGLT